MEKIKELLRELHLFHILRPIYHIILRIFYQRRITRIACDINQIFIDNDINIGKSVFIYQRSYFTEDGNQYISGGGERYASDLSDIIIKKKYTPVLFQIGNKKDKHPWVNIRNGILVIGLNIVPPLYGKVVSLIPAPTLSLYSGLGDFTSKKHHPNIYISHGITWDNPIEDVNPKDVLKLIDDTDSLVSVDTNTISWLRCTFSKTLTLNPINIHYLPNYVDLDSFFETEKNKTERIKIAFPRRCNYARGFWLINDILPIIFNNYSNVDFSFIGFIHDDRIRDAILKLQESFPGRVTHSLVEASEMTRVYQSADISLIPTLYSEGTSLSCLEAMACGSVVISTNIGGLTNLIIDNYNGLLINPDSGELLEAIDYLLKSPEKMNELKNNALAVSKAFSKQIWVKKWNKILGEYLK